MSADLNPDAFFARYVTCPLCRRDNVPLRELHGVILDEHPMGDNSVIGAYLTPVTPDTVRSQASASPLQLDLAYARVRCPASLAPLMPPEGT